jgi:Domain of unknown function (DUF4365)
MVKKPAVSQLVRRVLGRRGEALFFLAISDYKPFADPLFDATFLGETWPAVDYLVTLYGVRSLSPFFFAQVKTTSEVKALNAAALRIKLSKSKAQALLNLPGPTYLIGVHEPSKRVFIRAIDTSTPASVSQIPTTHELTPANLQRLYDEVNQFWASQKFQAQKSAFP